MTMDRRGTTHALAWLTRNHAHATIAQQTRGNPGASADVSRRDSLQRSEAVEGTGA